MKARGFLDWAFILDCKQDLCCIVSITLTLWKVTLQA